MTPLPRWLPKVALPLAFALPFGVYSFTMARVWALDTLYAIDSAEMVIAARTLGIDHPPGHPLYLILAHLTGLLPFALPDTSVIFASVISGALAALFLALALHERTGNAPAALGAGLTFAFGLIFWIHATIAEVYALQLAFLGLFLYLAARWLNTRRERDFYLLAFALGLGATANILLTALLAPASLYLAARSGAIYANGLWRAGRLLKAALCLLLGLTPFLYIPIRLKGGGFISDFVYLNGYELQSARWYWWYLSAEEFTGAKLFDTPLARYPALTLGYLQSYARNLSLPASVLALASLIAVAVTGLASLRGRTEKRPPARSRRERRLAEARARRARSDRPGPWRRLFAAAPDSERVFDATLALAFLCTLLPVLSYQVPDRDVFFMPSFFFLTALAGLGLHRVIAAAVPRLPGRLAPVGALALACAVPAYLLLSHYPEITRITRNETVYRQRLERFQNLPENALIVGEDDGHATRYKYFGIVRNLRPDVAVHTLGRLAPRYTGEVALNRPLTTPGLRAGLNAADRLRILNGLVSENPDRTVFAILDDRMPPEFDHFRTVRSRIDPYLLRIEPKPPAEEGPDPLPVAVRTREEYFDDIHFIGFEIQGLDRGISKTFGAPLPLGASSIDGIVKRGELFELAFVVRRTGAPGAKLFAEFAFVNDRMQVPSAHDFTASRQMEVLPESLPQGWYRKDRFTFKIPGFIPVGYHTLAVRVSRASAQAQGTYQGRPIRTLTPLQTGRPWRGQTDYRPLGRLWIE